MASGKGSVSAGGCGPTLIDSHKSIKFGETPSRAPCGLSCSEFCYTGEGALDSPRRGVEALVPDDGRRPGHLALLKQVGDSLGALHSDKPIKDQIQIQELHDLHRAVSGHGNFDHRNRDYFGLVPKSDRVPKSGRRSRRELVGLDTPTRSATCSHRHDGNPVLWTTGCNAMYGIAIYRMVGNSSFSWSMHHLYGSTSGSWLLGSSCLTRQRRPNAPNGVPP